MAQTISFNWKLSPAQRELFESDARFRVGMMGRRFGKNEVGSASVIDYGTNPSDYDFGADESPTIWGVFPTYRQAYRYGFLKVREKLPDVLIDDDETKGSEYGPSQIGLVTGTEFEFLSYTNPSGLQGAGVDLIWGDEWAYSDESIWHNDLRPMLMDSGGGAIFTSKPLGENHFFEAYKRGATPEQPFSDGKEPEGGYRSFHATAYDNPFIPDSEVDKAKETTPEGVFRQEYLADPQAGGTLLTLDMLETVDPNELNETVNYRWHVAVDIGVTMDEKKARENDTDYWAAAIVLEHPFKPKAYVHNVIRDRGQTPAQAAEWLKHGMDPLPTNKCYIESVNAQEWFLNEAKEVGLNPIGIDHDRPKEERITFLSVPFDNGNVKLLEGRDWSDFRTEWAGFPNANHDDQLDALEMALRHVDFGNATSLFAGGSDRQDRGEEYGAT